METLKALTTANGSIGHWGANTTQGLAVHLALSDYCFQLNEPTASLWLLRDDAGFEQVRKIGGVGRIAQKWSHVEDFLQGAQVGGMRIVQRARIGKALHISVSARRDDNLGYRVIKVVGIVAWAPSDSVSSHQRMIAPSFL